MLHNNLHETLITNVWFGRLVPPLRKSTASTEYMCSFKTAFAFLPKFSFVICRKTFWKRVESIRIQSFTFTRLQTI